MNAFYKFYCRTYQFVCKLAIPLLPYREPTKLNGYEEIADVMKEQNLHCALVVTDKTLHCLGICNNLLDAFTKCNVSYAVFDGTVANPTSDNVAQAVEMFRQSGCDCLVAIGGGSSMDCAKAVGAQLARPNKTLAQMKGVMKVRQRLPTLFAIPTTAGTGSEATIAAVITDEKTRHKYLINDFNLIPHYVLFDSVLTVGLPASVTAATGMDALTHAIEAYIGRSATKDARRNALDAAKIIFNKIVSVYNDGSDLELRNEMLSASYMAGLAITKGFVGYVHALAHALGGKYNVPHGLANAVLLPVVLRAYGKSAYKKLWKLGVYVGLFDNSTPRKEGAERLIEEIERLNRQLGIPQTLDCIVFEDIPQLAKTAAGEANPLYPVPKLMDSRMLEHILRQITPQADNAN